MQRILILNHEQNQRDNTLTLANQLKTAYSTKLAVDGSLAIINNYLEKNKGFFANRDRFDKGIGIIETKFKNEVTAKSLDTEYNKACTQVAGLKTEIVRLQSSLLASPSTEMKTSSDLRDHVEAAMAKKLDDQNKATTQEQITRYQGVVTAAEKQLPAIKQTIDAAEKTRQSIDSEKTKVSTQANPNRMYSGAATAARQADATVSYDHQTAAQSKR